MMIMPRPFMPYWPAYPEPERSRIEAAYRAAEAEWQRNSMITLTLNLSLGLLGPIASATVAIMFIWLLP